MSEEREQPRRMLPPISAFDSFIPQNLVQFKPAIEIESEQSSEGSEKRELKTPQYTLSDDLLILKAIFSYYGSSFNGKVPWSFWQAFSKTAPNARSSSSLYHHWNGSMKKKYGPLMNAGGLEQCIAWVEQTISSGKKLKNNPFNFTMQMPPRMPLVHNWSEPRTPLQGPMDAAQFASAMGQLQARYWEPS